MKLDEVAPWGRSFEEYRLMFNLSEADLNLRILGCGDGPASFNSEMTAVGRNVVSVDPIYVQGYSVEICPVPYEFHRGGHQMMRVYR